MNVGFAVGVGSGVNIGFAVGAAVGIAVDASVGIEVGTLVGLVVGNGVNVGFAVGVSGGGAKISISPLFVVCAIVTPFSSNSFVLLKTTGYSPNGESTAISPVIRNSAPLPENVLVGESAWTWTTSKFFIFEKKLIVKPLASKSMPEIA